MKRTLFQQPLRLKKLHGQICPKGLWSQLTGLLAMLVVLGGQHLVAVPLANDASQPAKKLPNNVKEFAFNRRLQDETVCQVTVRGPAAITNLLETLDGLEISFGDQKVTVPSDVCLGLNDLDLLSGVQVIDMGKTKWVVFVGGKGTSRWSLKVIIQNKVVIAREFNQANTPPEITRYATLTPGPVTQIKIIPDSTLTNTTQLMLAPPPPLGK